MPWSLHRAQDGWSCEQRLRADRHAAQAASRWWRIGPAGRQLLCEVTTTSVLTGRRQLVTGLHLRCWRRSNTSALIQDVPHHGPSAMQEHTLAVAAGTGSLIALDLTLISAVSYSIALSVLTLRALQVRQPEGQYAPPRNSGEPRRAKPKVLSPVLVLLPLIRRGPLVAGWVEGPAPSTALMVSRPELSASGLRPMVRVR